MSSSSPFPWQHSFPPFYTLQPHAETRKRQLAAWRSIILDYCQRRNATVVDVKELASSELFHNRDIGRRLTDEALDAVLEDLKSHGHLEWLDKSAKRRAHIYWRTPEQWGALIYAWAQENAMTGGAVCTFFELTEGNDDDQPFRGLEREMLIKALRTLETQKKAEIFPDDDGVKFF